MKLTFAGPPTGPGASYSWAGNKEVGEGRLTITESRPNDLVRIKLEFMKPFTATNIATFLACVYAGTHLTISTDTSHDGGFPFERRCPAIKQDADAFSRPTARPASRSSQPCCRRVESGSLWRGSDSRGDGFRLKAGMTSAQPLDSRFRGSDDTADQVPDKINSSATGCRRRKRWHR